MAALTLGTPVDGNDEPIGRLTALVCDPITGTTTHLVVNGDDVPGSERLVPMEQVGTQADGRTTLKLTRQQFFGLRRFETNRFMPGEGRGQWHLPFELAPGDRTIASHPRIPTSEVALRGGIPVLDAQDRQVGHVRTFVVDRASNDITHLTLRTGHIFSHDDVTLPMAEISAMTDDAIRLKIDAATVEERPSPADHHASRQLAPEHPADVGVQEHEPDPSHEEGVHDLANEVRGRLRDRGFSDTEILEWCAAYVEQVHTGDAAGLLEFIGQREQRGETAASPAGP